MPACTPTEPTASRGRTATRDLGRSGSPHNATDNKGHHAGDPQLATRIVVPCYNEAARLDVGAFIGYLHTHRHVGFVLVDDGSVDRTLAMLQEIRAAAPAQVEIIELATNAGKGEAVRRGLILAIDNGARRVGYWDADLATPLGAIDSLDALLEQRPDLEVALGARVALLGRRIERKRYRHYLGRMFATAASVVLDLPIYDTQCGAKLMRVTDRLRPLLDAPFDSRWIFDVELLARFQQAGGQPEAIYEMPLDRWRDVGKSKVKPTDFALAAGELIHIYRRYRLPRRYRRLFDLVTAPFIRYAAAGTAGTGVHYALLIVGVEALAMAPEGATVLGAAGGALVNYVINYHVTFASKAQHRTTLPRFLTVAAVAAGVNWLGMRLLTSSLDLHYALAQVVCTIAALAVGFVLNRLWTFGERN